MTILFSGIAAALVIVLAVFSGDLADAAARATRAQLAADAAALAAAAEAGPYGDGTPEAAARAFARANGAILLDCDCPEGAPEAVVKVAVGGVARRARAVFDPAALVPGRVEGLDPRLAAAVRRLLSAAGGRLHVISGFRSRREQRDLWLQAVTRYGSAAAADDWVAPPGRSMHERGLAVDLSGDLELAATLIARLGLPLYRPLANEPWHFELVGSRGL